MKENTENEYFLRNTDSEFRHVLVNLKITDFLAQGSVHLFLSGEDSTKLQLTCALYPTFFVRNVSRIEISQDHSVFPFMRC